MVTIKSGNICREKGLLFGPRSTSYSIVDLTHSLWTPKCLVDMSVDTGWS
jgi:hypothetical protein